MSPLARGTTPMARGGLQITVSTSSGLDVLTPYSLRKGDRVDSSFRRNAGIQWSLAAVGHIRKAVGFSFAGMTPGDRELSDAKWEIQGVSETTLCEAIHFLRSVRAWKSFSSVQHTLCASASPRLSLHCCLLVSAPGRSLGRAAKDLR